MVQTVKERLKKFPEVVDAMFGSIDAISLDAAKILHRPLLEENGGGDTGSTVQVTIFSLKKDKKGYEFLNCYPDAKFSRSRHEISLKNRFVPLNSTVISKFSYHIIFIEIFIIFLTIC